MQNRSLKAIMTENLMPNQNLKVTTVSTVVIRSMARMLSQNLKLIQNLRNMATARYMPNLNRKLITISTAVIISNNRTQNQSQRSTSTQSHMQNRNLNPVLSHPVSLNLLPNLRQNPLQRLVKSRKNLR